MVKVLEEELSENDRLSDALDEAAEDNLFESDMLVKVRDVPAEGKDDKLPRDDWSCDKLLMYDRLSDVVVVEEATDFGILGACRLRESLLGREQCN